MKNLIGAAIVSMEVVLTSIAAFAGTDLPALVEKWGLAGKWSTDCSPEATPRGIVAYGIEPDGRVIIDNGQSLTEVRIAMINSDGDLTLQTIPASGEEIRVLVLRRSGDTLRPIISGNERSDYAIRDGKFVASLKEASPLRRCES